MATGASSFKSQIRNVLETLKNIKIKSVLRNKNGSISEA
jgi:hypothetical protein